MAKRNKSESNGTALLDAPERPRAESLPSWREASVELLDLPEGMAAKLKHIGIHTAGSLYDYPAKTRRPYASITCVGEADAGAVVNALLAVADEGTEPPAEPSSFPTDAGAEAIEWRERIKEQAREVALCKTALTASAEVHKSAKKAWEAASERLALMVLEEPKPLPLFDNPRAAVSPEDEAWRAEPIAALELTPALTEKLHDQGFKTIGHIADWTAKDRRLTDINGVGERAAWKIEDALMLFFSVLQAKAAKAAKPEPESDAEEPEDEAEDD